MTRQRIIQESLELFAYYGYENTSLANIAEKVGIKKPSIYNHFENKQAIFLQVLHDVASREQDYFREQAGKIKSSSVQDHLYSIYQMYQQHMANSTEGLFFKRVTLFPPESFAEEIKRVFLTVEESLTTLIQPIFEQGKNENILRPLTSEMMTSAFYTLVDGLFLEENFYNTDVFEQRKQASWNVFWLGIQQPQKED